MASIKKSMLSKTGILSNSVLLVACLVVAAPAWAGRDAGQMIAQAKANQQVVARRQAAMDAATAGPASRPMTEVLPLDHGPRATTTPWLNAQRTAHAREAANAASATAMSPPSATAAK